jgi:ribosomal 30S subunit maturation factor RimM
MAYFNQERKAEKAPEIKKILKKYGVKGSLAVRHHSTFVLNIKSSKIDFINNYNENTKSNIKEYMDINQRTLYWCC